MSDVPLTITAAREALIAGDLTSQNLVEQNLAATKDWEPNIHALLEVLGDEALTQAREHDLAGTPRETTLPLAGIPIAIKDLILTTEGHSTAAAKILATFKSPYEATVVKKLKTAGAIVISKANLDEFAMGSTTEYSAFGVTKNPYDTSRVAGGSSGGSAATVAAGEVLGSLGTDTGGSIRLPASFCNVVGLKPTYGRVSRFGVIAYGSSLDQVGPFARTVKDVALLLQVLAGHDPYDATSSHEPVADYVAACGQSVAGLRVGVPREFFAEGITPEVNQIVRAAITQLKELGAEIVDISLPLTPAAIAVYFLIAKAEASANLARYDGLRYAPMPDLKAASLLEQYLEVRGKGFGPEVKRAILMGTFALSSGYYEAWYKQASKVRTLIRREYEAAFEQVDVIAGPVSPEPAFTIGSKADDPLAMYLADALTVPQPVAGVPTLSVPAGFTADGLPVGLQLSTPHFEEARLLQVAHAYEQSQNWWQQMPLLQGS